MNRQTLLQELLVEIAQEEVPDEIKMRALHKPVLQTLARQNRPKRVVFQRAVISLMFLTVMALFLVFTPQGRSFAQQILEIIPRADAESFPVPWAADRVPFTPEPTYSVPVIPADPESAYQTQNNLPIVLRCEQPEISRSYYCQIAAAESVVGYDLMEFPTDPLDITFTGVSAVKQGGEVTIEYHSSTRILVLRQGLGDYPYQGEWNKAPEAYIDEVWVNNNYGEYVRGHFQVKAGDTDATWYEEASRRLVWESYGRWFEIMERLTIVYREPRWIELTTMIELAESLVNEPIITKQLRHRIDHLQTIAEAEAAAGFDIHVPSMVPEGFVLEQVRYEPELSRVIITYMDENRSKLEIIQVVDNPYYYRGLTYPVVETVYIHDIPGQYASKIENQELAFWYEGTGPIGEADQVLIWKDVDRVYVIYSTPSFLGGARIDKENLLEIAESIGSE